MIHIQGNTPKEQLLSVDGILGGLLKKTQMTFEKLNKKNMTSFPFALSGYINKCVSGDIVCAHLSLANIELKRLVIMVDKLSKETEAFIVVRILSDNGKESASKIQIKQGTITTEDERKLKPGDRLSISIIYSNEAPEGIWVAMRGDRI